MDGNGGRIIIGGIHMKVSHAMSTNLWKVIRLPWDAIRYWYGELRKELFSGSRPTGRYFLVDAEPETIRAELGDRSYAPNWEFSYYKRGEILNLARVTYEERSVDGATYTWWQTHTRGWDHPDGVALHAHWELEPTEHPTKHLDGTGFDFDRGMSNLQGALDDGNLDYRAIRIE